MLDSTLEPNYWENKTIVNVCLLITSLQNKLFIVSVQRILFVCFFSLPTPKIRSVANKLFLMSSESESCSVVSRLFATPWTIQSRNSPGQNTEVGSRSLLQWLFPTQGSNPGLPHCRWIFYQLSHQGSPRILECVANAFSRGSPRLRN